MVRHFYPKKPPSAIAGDDIIERILRNRRIVDLVEALEDVSDNIEGLYNDWSLDASLAIGDAIAFLEEIPR
jgi:hypothetical protein